MRCAELVETDLLRYCRQPPVVRVTATLLADPGYIAASVTRCYCARHALSAEGLIEMADPESVVITELASPVPGSSGASAAADQGGATRVQG